VAKGRRKKAGALDGDYNLGERLRFLRESRKFSQKDFARAVGVSQSTIAHIETSRKDPSVSTLGQIARALDVDIATLFASKEVHVFDLPRLRRKYKSADQLTDAIYAALGKVLRYAKDIGME